VGHRIEVGRKAVGHANYFGVKRAARHTRWCTVATREVVNGKSVIENLEFADYDSLADSCRDYAWLITQGTPYHAAWARYQTDRGLHTLIVAVAATYATDPNYARLCTTIAGQANLALAIKARAKRQPMLQRLKLALWCALLAAATGMAVEAVLLLHARPSPPVRCRGRFL